MVIGKKLQKRRKELNLTRAQLAEIVHVTASAIANYENSISYPKPDILISLILALKIDANYLFEDYLRDQVVLKTYDQVLSEEEKDALTKYRELSSKGRRFDKNCDWTRNMIVCSMKAGLHSHAINR